MTVGKPLAVCDAGPLIHLDELGCLQLLDEFAVVVPQVVRREVSSHRPSLFMRAGIEFTTPDSAALSPTLRMLGDALVLDAGELAALALMAYLPGAILLTDDAAARLAAQELRYRVHGTVGVLLRSVRRGRLTTHQVLALLQQIPTRSSLHIRPGLLVDIIA
jgi:predicted nucleic acid-binding protein